MIIEDKNKQIDFKNLLSNFLKLPLRYLKSAKIASILDFKSIIKPDFILQLIITNTL